MPGKRLLLDTNAIIQLLAGNEEVIAIVLHYTPKVLRWFDLWHTVRPWIGWVGRHKRVLGERRDRGPRV